VPRLYHGAEFPLASNVGLGPRESFNGRAGVKQTVKAEPLLAKLNELRHEAEDDKTDIEYLTLHHAFCFISYRMSEFQTYLNEVEKKNPHHS